ncbi:MAG: hypothetical protein AB8G05_23690 [Oligoflexales bacterium]
MSMNPLYLIVQAIFVILSFVMASCGSTQTTENTEKIAKNVEVSASVAEGAATTLAIDTGSATGAQVIIDDGALDTGTAIGLDRVEQPTEFAEFTSENGDGESTFVTASSAIEVKGGSGDSSPSLASPMTIAIPFNGTTSLKIFLAGIAKTAANICVIHKSVAGELFFFRGKLLQIESSEEKIKFKSSTFGIYQLFFCGANSPNGFEDAGEKGISAPPPGADPSTFSSYGDDISFTLSIDSSTYAFDSAKYCLLVTKDGISDDTNPSVVSASEFSFSGGTMDLALEVDTSTIGDEALLVIAILMQSSSHSCNFQEGDVISSDVGYNHSYRFKSSKKSIHEGSANGTFGAGIYAITEKTIVVGSPTTVNSAEPFAVSKVCVSAISKNTEGTILARMFSNTKISGTSGESISVNIPNGMSGFSKFEFEVLLNNSCEQESFNYSDSYPLKLTQAHSDGKYYLAPVSLSIPEAVQAQLAIVSADGNVCAELYHGNFTSSNVATSDTSKNLGLWTLSNSGLIVYAPFGSEKMQGDTPIFDILFHLGSDCKSNFPGEISIASDDENLFD